MNNKQLIESELNKRGFKIGCYSERINKLKKSSIETIISKMMYGSTDIVLIVSGSKMICEICYVDNEVDLLLIKYSDYIKKFKY